MDQILTLIILIVCVVAAISYGLIGTLNLWIYYYSNDEKFPMFPILNPLSIASYELMIHSMFTFIWKEQKPNYKLKRIVNKTSKVFFGLVFLILISIIIRQIEI